MSLEARLAGVIVKDGKPVAYVYNCLKTYEGGLGEQAEEYLGDVVMQARDDAQAVESCKTKYGGGST